MHKLPGIINYIGLAIAIGIALILLGGTIKYAVSDEKYREKHKKEMIRAYVEGTLFILIGLMVYFFGD